jgi:hypothetical protein
MNRLCSRVVALLFTCLMASGLLMAQSDLGTISGYVKDPSGAVVPNAKVTISNKTGIQRQATANESGFYAVTNLPPAFYTVTVEAPGFQKYESTGNKLDPSAHLNVDANLVVGATTQTVEVKALAATLQTESSAVQKNVTRQQIDALELNGRNPIYMANLVPGVRGGTLADLNFGMTLGPGNINGQRNQMSLITYDGAPAVRTRSNGTSIGSADVDSTEEIQVLTSNYNAEYGRSSGGQIRIISKSGTENFHGEAYEYVRNTSLNSNTWSNNAAGKGKAPDHYNQFGYNIGGPFYIPNHFNTHKDKVFWYWGEEWVRRVYTDTASWTVPTLKMRAGDFSELLGPNIFYKSVQTIKDPATGQCYGYPTCTNIIPAPGSTSGGTPASANGLGILNDWPAPNGGIPGTTTNFYVTASHPQHQRKDTLAVDVNVTQDQRLRFRRVNYTWWEYQPLDGTPTETPKYFDRPNYTYSVDYIWTINPTMVNETLLTYSQDIVRIPVDQAHFLDRTKGAVQCPGCFGTNYGYIFPVGTKLIPTRIPSVNMTAFSTLSGGPYPSHSQGPIADLSDSLTLVKGNHTIKFGGLYEYSGENDNDEINVNACNSCTNNQNGQFLFSDGRAGGTGIAAANAALGLFDTYSELGNRGYTVFRGSMWEAFAQDGWKATQKLHVDYGIRWTRIIPYHAWWANMDVFDPAYYDPSKAVTVDPATGLITGSPTIDQLYNGMVIPGSGFPQSAVGRLPANVTSGAFNDLFHGLSNHYSDVHNDFQPRLGLAYQLNDKVVLRAGVGRFITRLGVSDSVFLGGNPPFQPNVALSAGSVDSLGSTGALAYPLVVTTQSKTFRNPDSWQMNGTAEFQVPLNSMLSVGYVGVRGLHNQRESDINQPTAAVVAANPCLVGLGVAPAPTKCSLDAFRPYQGFGSIRETDNVASSWYHSLQVSWNRHFTQGLMFGAAYTLSKSTDDGSAQRDVLPDTYNAHFMWGPSTFDVRHIFVFNYLYQLPFYKNQLSAVGRVLGGWQVSGIVQYQTGQPCSVSNATDYVGVGLDANYNDCTPHGGQFWVKKGNVSYPKTFGSGGQWFSASGVFTPPCQQDASGNCVPGTGFFNTQNVRDIIYQPGFQNWNLGLFKVIPVNERVRFSFRAEAFNIWNHPNWGGASGGGVNFDPKSSSFGKVTSKGSNRNIQLSLKLEF